MTIVRGVRVLALALLALAGAASAQAADHGFGAIGSSSPRIGSGSLATPMMWFDRSRLHLSTTVSVGTGFGGTTSGLQVTRLSYQFSAPLSMSVSLGNAFGSAGRDGNAFFLEGLDVAWRPSANTFFQVRYQDLRSPLQYRDSGFGFYRDPLR